MPSIAESSIPLRATGTPRYALIDALRGVAAMAVVCHHLIPAPALAVALSQIVPHAVFRLAGFGGYGVQIFFVLSGFVITHSLFGVKMTWKSFGNFAFRRQLRLDPPYLCVLMLTLLAYAFHMVSPVVSLNEIFKWQTVAANVTYLQGLLQAPQIVLVAWSLCIEIQFYVFFALLLSLDQRFNKTNRPGAFAQVTVLTFGIASLFIRPEPLSPYLSSYWFYFAAGIYAYWTFRRVTSLRVLPALFVIAFIVATWRFASGAMFAGLATGALIWIAAKKDGLLTWLNIPFIQYIGRISYSLYLVHCLVGFAIFNLAHTLTGDNPVAALMWVMVAIMTSILAGHFLQLFVEEPSMQLARRFKSDKDGLRQTHSPISHGCADNVADSCGAS